MHRLLSLIILGLASIPAMALDATEATASPGQWSTIVAILDSSNNHYLLKTSTVSDPAACMTELGEIATKVSEIGGYIWTTPDKKNMRYEKEESPTNYEFKKA